jgi:hypothetical protein
MNTMTQEYKDEIFDMANKNAIFLRIKGRRYPAQIYGRRLSFPFIRANNRPYPASSELSWEAVERLARKEIDTVNFD